MRSGVLLGKWAGADLNRRHRDFQSLALPTELPARQRPVKSSSKPEPLETKPWVTLAAAIVTVKSIGIAIGRANLYSLGL